jgi:hypothetical protein
MRILGDSPKHNWILARDASDIHYPYDFKHKDFNRNPRWKEYEIVDYHPLGLLVRLRQCYAYCDEGEKHFDFAEPSIALNNPHKQFSYDDDDKKAREILDLIRDYWERFPHASKAMFHEHGIIKFKDMMVIDDKGDSLNKFPHIFVEFINGSPITGSRAFLEKGVNHISLEEFQRKVTFPKDFPEPKFGTIYVEKGLMLPSDLSQEYVNFRGGDLNALYDVDGRFSHLQKYDVAVVRHEPKEDRFLQVTHTYKLSGSQLLQDHPETVWAIQRQIGRAPTADDSIQVLEVRSCYKHQWERS